MAPKTQAYTDADMRKAIDRNSLATVKRIIEAGYDFGRPFVTDTTFDRDCVGKNALIWAVKGGKEKIARLLIESGADVNVRDRVGQAALHFAATQVSPTMLNLLIEAGADVHAAHVGMQTPLHYAIESDRVSHSRVLVEAGAEPSFIPEKAKGLYKPGYTTPFQTAVETNNLELVELFAERGGVELFDQKTLAGKAVADLCPTDLALEKFLALRSELVMRAQMGSAVGGESARAGRQLGLRPL
jgi:hypothetical protein